MKHEAQSSFHAISSLYFSAADFLAFCQATRSSNRLTFPGVASGSSTSVYSVLRPKSLVLYLFMIIIGRVAVTPDKRVAFGGFEILSSHLGDEFAKRDLGRPTELFPRLARIP